MAIAHSSFDHGTFESDLCLVFTIVETECGPGGVGFFRLETAVLLPGVWPHGGKIGIWTIKLWTPLRVPLSSSRIQAAKAAINHTHTHMVWAGVANVM